jgi:ABC-2 type transport system permease protein
MNKTLLVARREFLTRVQKKTFLLTTIGVPLLIAVFYAALIFFQFKSTDTYVIALSDEANVFEGKVPGKKDDLEFKLVKADTATLRKQLDNKTYDAYLYIPASFSLNGSDSMEFRSAKAMGFMTRDKVEDLISSVLEEKRWLQMNLTKAAIDSIRKKDDPIRFTSAAGKKETGAKAGISYGVGMLSGFLIYIILFVYGTMVMRGVMEEKVSRIAEVIVSSVKPFQLMMGKITGIGAVGLVQFLIWILLIFGIQMALPLIFPEIGASLQSAPNMGPGAGQATQAVEDMKNSGALNGFMSDLQTINFGLIIGCFLFYFLGGYLVYSALFAAVGSAVNEDPQDAQALLFPIMMPIIFAFVIMTNAVNDPNSSMAVFGSLFPFTSPIVMMARVAHGIPDGVTVVQLLISMALLIVTFLGTTWVAGKIYRTGILLYGKKVTWKEMIKWAFRSN